MAVVEYQLGQLIRLDEWLLPEERPAPRRTAHRRPGPAGDDQDRTARSTERKVARASQRRRRRHEDRAAARAARYFTGSVGGNPIDDADWQDDVA